MPAEYCWVFCLACPIMSTNSAESTSVSAHNEIGTAYWWIGDTKQAQVYYIRAAELDLKYEEFLRSLLEADG